MHPGFPRVPRKVEVTAFLGDCFAEDNLGVVEWNRVNLVGVGHHLYVLERPLRNCISSHERVVSYLNSSRGKVVS